MHGMRTQGWRALMQLAVSQPVARMDPAALMPCIVRRGASSAHLVRDLPETEAAAVTRMQVIERIEATHAR